MPSPARTTVLPFPVRSYARPTRGPQLFQELFTKPLVTPGVLPGTPSPLLYIRKPFKAGLGPVPKYGFAAVQRGFGFPAARGVPAPVQMVVPATLANPIPLPGAKAVAAPDAFHRFA